MPCFHPQAVLAALPADAVVRVLAALPDAGLRLRLAGAALAHGTDTRAVPAGGRRLLAAAGAAAPLAAVHVARCLAFVEPVAAAGTCHAPGQRGCAAKAACQTPARVAWLVALLGAAVRGCASRADMAGSGDAPSGGAEAVRAAVGKLAAWLRWHPEHAGAVAVQAALLQAAADTVFGPAAAVAEP